MILLVDNAAEWRVYILKGLAANSLLETVMAALS